MTHPRVEDRIAQVYIEHYKAHGFKAAKEYATRVLGDNKDLQKAVKSKVEKKIKAMMTKGK